MKKHFQNELLRQNIYGKLNQDVHANPNENDQILSSILSEAKVMHMHKTTRRFNKRKDKKEKWMTNELLNQINQSKN